VFDQSFALPPVTAVQDLEDLLSVRIAGDRYAIRTCEMSGLGSSPRITPVPSKVKGFLGVTAIRGVVTPVYCLAEFLGYGTDRDPVHWLSLFGTHEPVGLTFGSLEGYARISRANLCVSKETDGRQYVAEVARIANLLYPIISLASVAQTIKGKVNQV